MKKRNDILITAGILALCFLAGLVISHIFGEDSGVPAVFVLGVLGISVVTEGYIFGIISALLSVLAVNYAFTFPYFAFDFMDVGNVISGVVLLCCAGLVCGLTARLKKQDMIKAESEKERMRANLLRAVSHDLRTPLTTIYGSSSALLENYQELSQEQSRRILEGIREDSLWLNRMVENLLSITKLDGEGVKVIKTETVLDELVDSILVKFAKSYPDQKVKIYLPDSFVTIPMDALLIEQVAINILENAVQHAKGMTELVFAVYIKAGKAYFEIIDNGCGIPPAKLDKIFMGNMSTEEMADGGKRNAGIGLSVCASIIKAHGGLIEAENLKCGGSIFRFVLDMEEEV